MSTPTITCENVIVGTYYANGHHEVHGDRWFFEGGDDEGYESEEDAEDALAAWIEQNPNHAMLERDGKPAPAAEKPPAGPPADAPAPQGLLTVANIERRLGLGFSVEGQP